MGSQSSERCESAVIRASRAEHAALRRSVQRLRALTPDAKACNQDFMQFDREDDWRREPIAQRMTIPVGGTSERLWKEPGERMRPAPSSSHKLLAAL
jgi:hypothetical protein